MNDFVVHLLNPRSIDDPKDALFGSETSYNVITNDVLVFKLNNEKWGEALFDVKQICLTTVGIESFRILLKDIDGRNIERQDVCIMF